MRISTGIHGLNELIDGGFLAERVYLVCGPPGSGKTTFGMQFLTHGAALGEVGLYATLLESPQNIIDDMSNYSMNLSILMKMKKLFFLNLGPKMDYGFADELYEFLTPKHEVVRTTAEGAPPSPAVAFKEIKKHVSEHNVKRLVIDSVSAIRFTTSDPSLEEKEINRLIRNLKELGCTTILLSEMIDTNSYTTEQFASHGLIFLHNFLHKKTMTRALQIVKMRGIKHDCNMRGLQFHGGGIKVVDYLD
ncbi:MAG: ATPase [Methanosarcinaceae archaeon]|nr:ATPase [Methanosarcinaceae archaeon]